MGSRISLRAALAGALVGVLLAPLAGCGGGGDEAPPVPAVPIADTAEAWWNADADARWVYDVTDTRPGYPAKRVNLVTIDGTATFDGKTFTRFAHSSSIADAQPDEELRYFDGSSVYVAGDVSLDPTVPLIGSYAELPAPLVAGVTTTVLDQSEDFDDDGDGRADYRLSLLVTVLLGTEASRTVPAGSFSNVLWARTEATITITEFVLNQSASLTSTQTVWYAPGVGQIRRELIDPDPTLDASNNFVVEELSGVSVVAVKAGKVPGFVALEGIGAGTTDTIAGIPALATDGANVFVVSRAIDPAGNQLSAGLVGVILAPDGSIVARRTLIETSGGSYIQAGAAATFDGLNYRAFWVRPDGVFVGQRASAAGDVLDPPSGVPVPDVAVGSIARVAAASNGTNVLLVWQRMDTVGWVTEGRLLDRDGTGVSPIFNLGVGEAELSVAASSGSYLIARTTLVGGTAEFLRVEGNTGVPGVIWQELSAPGPIATAPRVIAHPDGFLAGWTSWASALENRILSRRITENGSVLDAADIEIDGNPVTGRFGFALTGSTQGLFAGWVKDLTGDPIQTADRARATRAPWASGAPSFGAPGSYWYTAPGLQPPPDAYPVAVAAGDRFVMAWLENLQTDTTPSDRVVATIVYPPAAR